MNSPGDDWLLSMSIKNAEITISDNVSIYLSVCVCLTLLVKSTFNEEQLFEGLFHKDYVKFSMKISMANSQKIQACSSSGPENGIPFQFH